MRLKSADEALSESIIAADLKPEIGTETLTTQDITKIDQELKENPPQRFDAARKVRVYQGYFQFVELSLTGCQLTRHTINIPKSLLNIAEDSDLRDRIRSTCRLVDDTSTFARKVKKIEEQVSALRKDFTRSVGKNYGVVILRRAREDFEKELQKIKVELEKLRESVKKDLDKEILRCRKNLTKMLLPGVMSNPPIALTAQLFSKLSKKTALKFIRDELSRELPLTESLIGDMKLNCNYKDVTYETLNDEDFIKAIEEKYPYNNFAKLYSEQETIGQR